MSELRMLTRREHYLIAPIDNRGYVDFRNPPLVPVTSDFIAGLEHAIEIVDRHDIQTLGDLLKEIKAIVARSEA